MNERPFGQSNETISEIGLGTWQLGGAEWGDVSEAQALDVLRTAYESGTTFFDTADIYGTGRSEQLLGRFFSQLGSGAKSIKIATKLGRRSDAPNGWPQNFTLASIRRHTQESLQRLGLEQVFLQQFHCIPFEVIKEGEVFESMRILQKEGLIRHWGVSVETVEEGLFCLNQPGCSALQVIFNIFRQKVGVELLPKAQAAHVAILARVPLASGLLSGRMSRQQAFVNTDHRHFNANGEKFNVGETFAGVPFDMGLDFVEKIKSILKPNESAPLAALALRWILDHPAVTSVIPGATKPYQAKMNTLASLLRPLSKETHDELSKLYEAEIRPAIRGRY